MQGVPERGQELGTRPVVLYDLDTGLLKHSKNLQYDNQHDDKH
jgi:hypothetical protein